MAPSSENDFSLDREPTAREQAALTWVVAVDRGMSPSQTADFEAWLAGDTGNRELFEEFGGTWAVMQRARADVVAPIPFPSRRPRAWRPYWQGAFVAAAAAVVVVGYLRWWQPHHYRAGVSTQIGSLRELKLPDGTVVELNTDSAVTAVFSVTERRVTLNRGEAHFNVAQESNRPFIVEAAAVDVRAVGTAFNVRLKPESVDVLVIEGRVQVAPGRPFAENGTRDPISDNPQAVTELGAGEHVCVPANGRLAERPQPQVVPREEVRRLLSWQEDRLDFSDATLDEMVAEFNRYNSHKLKIADPALGKQRFGGIFRPSDHAGFVRMLKENFGVQADARSEETTLRAAR